jgi:hypothetical protein
VIPSSRGVELRQINTGWQQTGTQEPCIRVADRNAGRQGLIGSAEASGEEVSMIFSELRKAEKMGNFPRRSLVLHFFFSLHNSPMALPVQLPRPLRPASAARPHLALASLPPLAHRRAPIGNAAGRSAAPALQTRRRRRRKTIASVAALPDADDPDAPPPYELDDYTPEANAEYWERRPVSVLKRGLVIGTRIEERVVGRGGFF